MVPVSARSIRFITREFHQMFGICYGILESSLRLNRVFIRHIQSSKFSSTDVARMMKLYTDKGNPFLFRVLAAKNLAGIPLTVEYVNHEGMKLYMYTEASWP